MKWQISSRYEDAFEEFDEGLIIPEKQNTGSACDRGYSHLGITDSDGERLTGTTSCMIQLEVEDDRFELTTAHAFLTAKPGAYCTDLDGSRVPICNMMTTSLTKQ